MNTPKLLKPKQLCSIFGVKVKTIYAMLYRFEIPGAFQIGKNWYINEAILSRELEKLSAYKQRPKSLPDDPYSDRHGIGF